MSKDSRDGGKFSGSHTTLIPAAASVADKAETCPFVYNIVLGFIKAGLNSANGQRRVKIIREAGASVLLAVRDNASQQEIRVYTRSKHETVLAIARGAREAGLHISFENRDQ